MTMMLRAKVKVAQDLKKDFDEILK